MERYLMTQSLLSAFSYMFDCYEGNEEDAEKEFLAVLNREQSVTNEAMQDGIDFEDAVVNYCNGVTTEDKRFNNTYKTVGEIVSGGQFQATAYKNKTICGIDFLLYAKCDCIKAGKIFDIKFSKSYEVGKYLQSPQHPMYLECVSTANEFSYLISNGNEVCVESYSRNEITCIDSKIIDFINYLRNAKLIKIYFQKWKAN